MNNPLVSICIPTYNGEKFLETCLDSAIAQTYRNIEIIVVDDCSTDRTYEIIRKYEAKNTRIKLFRNEKNRGLVPNWNRCMELSTGEWIKFLFQDDSLSPDCVEVMVNSLSDSDKIVSSGRRLILDESLDEATKNYSITKTLTFERLGIISPTPVFIPAEKISSFAVQNICINFIGEPTVIMFKKEVSKELGIFNPDLIQICDIEYFLRIATNFGLKYIPQPLTRFRVHKGSASSSNISDRIFLMNGTDPIIIVHEFLYKTFFNRFREAISIFQRMKLRMFFIMRVHESYINSLNTTPENLKKFRAIEKKYPGIARYARNTFLSPFFLGMVKMMVRVRKIFRS